MVRILSHHISIMRRSAMTPSDGAQMATRSAPIITAAEYGVGRPFAAEKFGGNTVGFGKKVSKPSRENGRGHRRLKPFSPIVGTIPTDSLVVLNRRCCTFHEQA